MTDPTRSTTPPPSSNQSSTALATTIVGLYVLSEAQILGGITSILRRTPATLAGRQAAVPRIRRLVRQVVARLVYTSNDMVRQMVTTAVEEGSRDAIASVSKALVGRGGFTPPPGSTGGAGGSSGSGRALTVGGEPFDLSMPHGERAAQAIRNDIESELQDVRFRITRLPEDIYKAIAPHGAIRQVLANGFTGAQAQAVAWRVFVSQGVTGFTDKSGRDWALSSYVEMAVRTASMRAYNASHLARMHALGIHYFTVSDDGHPCPLCFPWEGKVLTDGHVANPEMPVDGTIGDATAAGLFHPNCRHILTTVLPGFTVLPPPREWTPEMAQQYLDTQKQRRLEVAVRKAKRALEYAYTPAEQKRARADVTAAQAKVRQFVNAHEHLMRQSRREQLNLTDAYAKLPVL
jgi:hypothetical protein